jgi:hypothetical protein
MKIIKRTVKLLYDNIIKEKTLIFKEVDKKTSEKMMVENHYSHKWNKGLFGKINIGIFENDILLGIASFGYPMNPKSYKNISVDFVQENLLELNRLWIDDTLGKNAESILLSVSWKILKSEYPRVKAIQSFADGRLGCGTIYKATNFKYYGYRESLFFENIEDGLTYHKVPMENTATPSGMIKLNTLMIQGKLKPFIVKTYRYIMILNKNIKIDLIEQPYPIYEKGVKYISNYEINKGLVIRSYILANILCFEQQNILLDWILKNTKVEDFEAQMNNETVKKTAIAKNKTYKLDYLLKNYKKIYKKEIKLNIKSYNQTELF